MVAIGVGLGAIRALCGVGADILFSWVGVDVAGDGDAPDWRGTKVGNQPSRRNLLGQAQAQAQADPGDRERKGQAPARWSDNPLTVADLGRGGAEALLKAASGGGSAPT